VSQQTAQTHPTGFGGGEMILMGKRYRTIQETRALHLRHLEKLEFEAGRVVAIKFLPSAMIAGPCKAARLAAGAVLNSATRKLPPFDACIHPNQCGCMFVVDEEALLT
jgi:hypothetical protein